MTNIIVDGAEELGIRGRERNMDYVRVGFEAPIVGEKEKSEKWGINRRFEPAGMSLVEMVLADRHGWDRYEAPQWMAVDDFLRAHPDDPDAAELREWKSKDRRAYLQYGRRYFRWGVFVLRERQ